MVLPPSPAGGPRPAVLDVTFVLRGQVAVPSIVVLQASQGHPVALLLVARRAEQGEVVVGVTPAVGLWPYVVYFQGDKINGLAVDPPRKSRDSLNKSVDCSMIR